MLTRCWLKNSLEAIENLVRREGPEAAKVLFFLLVAEWPTRRNSLSPAGVRSEDARTPVFQRGLNATATVTTNFRHSRHFSSL